MRQNEPHDDDDFGAWQPSTKVFLGHEWSVAALRNVSGLNVRLDHGSVPLRQIGIGVCVRMISNVI